MAILGVFLHGIYETTNKALFIIGFGKLFLDGIWGILFLFLLS